MPTLTKRVQVLLEPPQFARLEEIAKVRKSSVGALIREAVGKEYFRTDRKERLAAVERMAAMTLPVADWEQMERESVGGSALD
ncbi:MAG: ribbon-helix-helix protein, CopG family [Chloroflexi bacterium]|nr:ribbon-helix-helix protein, CopG family [Chloroflexota bacterium]